MNHQADQSAIGTSSQEGEAFLQVVEQALINGKAQEQAVTTRIETTPKHFENGAGKDNTGKQRETSGNQVKPTESVENRQRQAIEEAFSQIASALAPILGEHTGRVTNALQDAAKALTRAIIRPKKEADIGHQTEKKKETWAEMVERAATNGFQWKQAAPKKPGPQQNGGSRTLGVKIQADEIRGKSEVELLAQIKKMDTMAAKGVTAVRKMGESRYNIETTSESARNEMQREESWLKIFGEGAACEKPKFLVIAHGVRVQRKEKAEWERQIIEQNQGLHQGLRKATATWKHWKRIDTKRYGSVIIELDSASQADRIIEKGLILYGVWSECAKHQTRWDYKQCFKCLGFGHVSVHCNKKEHCEKCGGEHQASKCPNPVGSTCSNCRRKGHGARNWECPTMITYRERIDKEKRMDTGRYEARIFSPTIGSPVGTRTASPDGQGSGESTQIRTNQSETSRSSESQPDRPNKRRRPTESDSQRSNRAHTPASKAGEAKRAVGRPKACDVRKNWQKNTLDMYRGEVNQMGTDGDKAESPPASQNMDISDGTLTQSITVVSC